MSETRPYRAGKQPHSIVDRLRAAEVQLERADERLADLETALREKAAASGLRAAKKQLKKIDPVFSGAGYDPHDVKVIFDPIAYVVFSGMSHDKIREIVLLANAPRNNLAERLYTSIEKTIQKGNLDFKTLRVDERGRINDS